MPSTDGVSSDGADAGGNNDADNGVSDKTAEAVDKALSDGGRNEPGNSAAGAGGPTDEMSIEDAVATQERLEAEGKTAKSGYENASPGQTGGMTTAEALDQEVSALNAAAAGQPVGNSTLAVEAVQDLPGFELTPDAVVTQAAFEIKPSGNIAGRDYGVVTPGRDGFAT